jgi:hypothetical protein
VGCGSRVLVILCLTLVVRVAVAQSPADRASATALQAEGLKLLDAGDAASALQKFTSAYALVPSPKVLFNMGRAHVELGHQAEAYQCFDQFLAEATNVPPESRGEAERMRSQLRPRLAFIDVVGPPAAVLTVDGRRRGILPLARPLALEPGARGIRVEADGKVVTDKRLDLTEGSTLRLVVEVTAPPAPPPMVVAARAAPPPPSTPSPFGRWWFWTAAAVVVVAGAVGVAAAAGGFSRDAGCPPDRRCM